jgi:hypothetical protein
MNFDYQGPHSVPEEGTISYAFQFLLSTLTERFLCMLAIALKLIIIFFLS